MSGGRLRSRRKKEEDDELNVIPIMNMFMVLIPFLLMSASFFHIKSIDTSVPIQASGNSSIVNNEEVKLTVIVEIKPAAIRIDATADEVDAKTLGRYSLEIAKPDEDKYPWDQLGAHLERIKQDYPASDTLLLIPDEATTYDTIIQAMDAARHQQVEIETEVEERKKLFPRVILSARYG